MSNNIFMEDRSPISFEEYLQFNENGRGNLGDMLVVINLPVQVRLCHVLQGIFVFRLLDKVKPFVEFQHKKRPPFYFSLNVASLKRSPVHGAGGRERRYGAP